MRKSRFSEAQIVQVLHEWEAGAKMADLIRRHGVTEQTLYRWKKKFGGMQGTEAKRLRALEEEDRQLKRLVADQALNLQVVKELLGKKVVTPAQRRVAVTSAMQAATLSERQACRYTGFARTSQRYRCVRASDTTLRECLQTLALLRPRWGYRRLYRLLRREGARVNRKRVQRVYQEAGLSVMQRKRKRVAVPRIPIEKPSHANERWSMDFVSDALGDGRKFRALTIVDDYTRECPAITVDRVAAVLTLLARTRGLPRAIVCDNGPEFRSEALDQWADAHHVHLHFIDLGKPVQNAYAESINGRLRDECLNESWFVNLHDAQYTIEAWRIDYNEHRPHSSFAHRTPAELAKATTNITSSITSQPD
ncbi:MAG: IS3 family transposase [Gemmatimonadaceae bacterium]